MQKGDFKFTKNYYETCQNIREPLLRLVFYDTICKYGVTEEKELAEYPITENQRQLMQSIVESIISIMENKKRRNQDGDFLFRKSFYEVCQEVKEPLLRLAFYETICEYGVLGKSSLAKYPIAETDRQLIQAIVNPIFSSIDATKKRFKRAQEIGRIGGKMGGRGNKKEIAKSKKAEVRDYVKNND